MKQQTEVITLLADSDQLDINNFLNETLGSALIDSGCTSSVCGEFWLKAYIDSLSSKEKEEITYHSSNRWFIFGNGRESEIFKKCYCTIAFWV